MGIISACLPTLRPVVRLVLGDMLGLTSGNKSSNGGGKSLTMQSGTGRQNLSNQPRVDETDGSFERLSDTDRASDNLPIMSHGAAHGVWTGEGAVSSQIKKGSRAKAQEIPLQGIVVKKDIHWEERPARPY